MCSSSRLDNTERAPEGLLFVPTTLHALQDLPFSARACKSTRSCESQLQHGHHDLSISRRIHHGCNSVITASLRERLEVLEACYPGLDHVAIAQQLSVLLRDASRTRQSTEVECAQQAVHSTEDYTNMRELVPAKRSAEAERHRCLPRSSYPWRALL